MTLIWPGMLVTLLLLPLLVGLYLELLRRRERVTGDLGPLGLVQSRSGQHTGRRRHLPPALYLCGLTFLLLALARPEMPVSLPRVEGTVILAFDVSNSMLANDLEPSRIEAAKEAARAFVANQPSTVQVGVVAFGNGGLVVQPPTNAQGDILAAIERISPQGGTSLGQGIFTALNAIAGEAIAVDAVAPGDDDLAQEMPSFSIDDYSSAVIMLLTDGENTSAPEPLDVAQLAAEAGVRVYPVGIGSAAGTVLEVDGFNVVTQLDEAALQAIADVTNGSYYRASDATSLQDIYQKVDLQMTIKGEKMEVTSILATIGAFFFLLAAVLSMAWFGRVP
jgi:Ca-activated chloride channel family protein